MPSSAHSLARSVVYCLGARGLRVPQDLAVSGFGNADFSAHMLPSITTVHVDGPRIGQLAAQRIMGRCRGVPPQKSVLDLGFTLIERESTAAAPVSFNTP